MLARVRGRLRCAGGWVRRRLGECVAAVFLANLAPAGPAAGFGGGAHEAGLVEIAGTPAGRGVECPLFRLDDGEVISLTGLAPEGTARVVLAGRWQARSPCRQGRSFRVAAVRPAGDG